MTRLYNRARYFVLAATMSMSVLTGCVTVPPETVELSHTIGRDLEELHRSHRALVELHFRGARNEVDAFIDNTYRPALIELTARDARLVEGISTIIDNDPGRLPAYLTRFLQAVDPRVEAKRQELLEPIVAQELALLDEIDGAHSRVQAANAVISGHLASIRDVHEAQSEVLAIAGLPDLRELIGASIADVSNRAERLNRRGQEVNSTIDDVTQRVEELDELISEAFGNGDGDNE
ncbi:hypothetical protein [Hyphobacterium sp.]|uniref:hypothetical protein n=1 Tax=Hyphobacterium sp. TaxID=2004662 RepID=UPI00374A1F4F